MDQDKIISGSADGTIKIWEKSEGKLLNILSGHTSSVKCLNYHQSYRILVSGIFINLNIRIQR